MEVLGELVVLEMQEILETRGLLAMLEEVAMEEEEEEQERPLPLILGQVVLVELQVETLEEPEYPVVELVEAVEVLVEETEDPAADLLRLDMPAVVVEEEELFPLVGQDLQGLQEPQEIQLQEMLVPRQIQVHQPQL